MGSGLGVAMSCGVGCRCSSDPVLLWLWHRPEATARIGPLAWESPYAAGAAQGMAKRQKKKKVRVKLIDFVVAFSTLKLGLKHVSLMFGIHTFDLYMCFQ